MSTIVQSQSKFHNFGNVDESRKQICIKFDISDETYDDLSDQDKYEMFETIVLASKKVHYGDVVYIEPNFERLYYGLSIVIPKNGTKYLSYFGDGMTKECKDFIEELKKKTSNENYFTNALEQASYCT